MNQPEFHGMSQGVLNVAPVTTSLPGRNEARFVPRFLPCESQESRTQQRRHKSNGQNLGDYTTHLCRNFNLPLQGSLRTNQYNGMSAKGFVSVAYL